MADCITKHAACAVAALFFGLFNQLTLASPYQPIDNILIDCGASSQRKDSESRNWAGDIGSNFFPSDLLQNAESLTLEASTNPVVDRVPYTTARLSHSQFTYSIPVSPGQKFIRLYFYPYTYNPTFDRSKAVFSIRIGLYTLLRDFNASVNADASNLDVFFREFCVSVEENDQKLDLTFIPTNHDSYAFINGIEIVSMPTNLYHTPTQQSNEESGPKFIGQSSPFFPIQNNTFLEMVYRMNIGGRFVSLVDDTGMFRTWSEESNFLGGSSWDARPANITIKLNYSKIQPYIAPEEVYTTARTMGPNSTQNKKYNLTWEYPIDPGFFYMIRLHFCEFQSEINDTNDRVFLIYIKHMIAEPFADVFRWASGKGSPYYKDYVVLVSSSNFTKKVNLSVQLQPNPDDNLTRHSNVILNGVEIFKLNDSSGNLGGQNPDPPHTASPVPPLQPSSTRSKTMVIVIFAAIVGMVVILALSLLVFWRCRIFHDQTSSHGTSQWTPFSISTNKSIKTSSSNLPSDLCRYFSLAEIRTATKNFDNIFIIGVGGFGDVYKGYIDNGGTQVAIKRLKPGSQQGEHEFKTEIEMLSQLRHLHLVSLIGYCNEGNEMILVYDYVAHGTLRNHLYGGNEQPLTWKQRLQICIGSARGLHYLHTGAKHTIIHRDVKTTNILLDDKWVSKVSDFGLSKVGSTNMSKAHISTVVKGSFGYLDPEYYRRQQLTEKSDVYSFGVILCEVLCSRPPLMRNAAEKEQVYLAEWVRRCNREKRLGEIIDPNIKNQISPECLRKFIEITVSCIEDEGIKRPSMNDVVWGLEFALQLQEASKKKKGVEDDEDGGEGKEQWLMDETLFSSTDYGRGGSSTNVNTNNCDDSSYGYSKNLSGTVFSPVKDPAG